MPHVLKARLALRAIGLHRRSPAWHRHARAVRSRARTRSRHLRAQGLPARLRDRNLLLSHHAAPPASSLMGKRGQQGRGWPATDSEWGGSRWRLWRGGFSPKAKAGPPWKAPARSKGRQETDSGTKMIFPSYDDHKPDELAIVPVVEKKLEAPLTAGEGHSFVKTVQSAVNFARKLDSRVTKLQREYADRQLLWDSYVHEMKQMLQKEKSRFVQEQQATAQALQEAQSAQAQAYAQLQQSLGGGAPDPTGMDQEAECEEWQAMLHSLESQPGPSSGACLQQLTQALVAAGVPLDTPGRTAPTTPPRRAAYTLPMTPPASSRMHSGSQGHASGQDGLSLEPLLQKDPYMQSPSLAHFGVPISPAVAAAVPPGLPSPVPDGTVAEASRPVENKDLTDQSGGPSLSERLSEKRRAKRAAMAPFGVESRRIIPTPVPAEPGALRERCMPTALVDDDGEEELDTASPGLGNLE